MLTYNSCVQNADVTIKLIERWSKRSFKSWSLIGTAEGTETILKSFY